MKNKKLLTAIALASFGTSGIQAAEFYPGYLGISVGEATVNDLCDLDVDRCEDSAITGRLYGGSQFTGFANFEFGYRYLDDVSIWGTVDGWTGGIDIDGHFFDATLQMGLPESGPFKIFAKAGVVYWQLNYDASLTNGSVLYAGSDDDSGASLRTGIGASYEVSDGFRVRADWDLILDVGDEDYLGESDINVFSIGPEFLF